MVDSKVSEMFQNGKKAEEFQKQLTFLLANNFIGNDTDP
jgi:hypothetical protein